MKITAKTKQPKYVVWSKGNHRRYADNTKSLTEGKHYEIIEFHPLGRYGEVVIRNDGGYRQVYSALNFEPVYE